MKLVYRPKWAFSEIGRKLGWKVYCHDGRVVVIKSMWSQALSTESQFCKAVVAAGYLTETQMQHASRRYRLGKSIQGGVIFWQIDQEDRIHDGKVMYYKMDCHRDKSRHPNWVSSLISKRNHWEKGQSSHCLFGLHLLYDEQYELSDYDGLGIEAWIKCMKTKFSAVNGSRFRVKGESLVKGYGLKVNGESAVNGSRFRVKGESAVKGYGLKVKGESAVNGSRFRVKGESLVKGYGLKVSDNCQFYILNSQLTKSVAVVEAEKSAVILSEHFPEYLWMATGGLGEVQAEKFRPLRGRKVIFFPDTDPDGTAYRRWYEAAQEVQRQLWWEDSPPIYVSPILEERATAEQKERKIDLVDFLFEKVSRLVV